MSSTRADGTGANEENLTLLRMLLLAAVLPASLLAQASGFAGTYRISICKQEPCTVDDTAAAHVYGHLVLSDSLLTAAMFPSELSQIMAGRFFRAPGTNACYGLTSNSLHRSTYAGGSDADRSQWDLLNDATGQIRFYLYRSPDAGHIVNAVVSGGELRGIGTSSGAGAGGAPAEWGPDLVVGRRIGPVDLAPCAAAGLARRERLNHGLWPHVVSQTPPFAAQASAYDTADSTQLFLIFFGQRLLLPPPSFERAGVEFVRGRQGAEAFGWEPDIWTIGPSGARDSIAAYADEALSRIAELRAKGVRPSQITVIGVGPSTAVAAEIAARADAPVGFVFVGSCEQSAPRRSRTRPAAPVLDVFNADTPAGNRCASHFDTTASLTNLALPGPDSSRPAPGGNVAPASLNLPEQRRYLWADSVAAWVRRRAR